MGGKEHAGEDFSLIENRFDENVRLMMDHAINPVKMIKRRGYSINELAKLIIEMSIPNIGEPDPRFDLIYIDGSHQASDVLLDATLSFQLLKLNGVLIFDDYNVIDETQTKFNIPKIAIDAFISVHENRIGTMVFNNDETNEMIPASDIYQLYLKKLTE